MGSAHEGLCAVYSAQCTTFKAQLTTFKNQQITFKTIVHGCASQQLTNDAHEKA